VDLVVEPSVDGVPGVGRVEGEGRGPVDGPGGAGGQGQVDHGRRRAAVHPRQLEQVPEGPAVDGVLGVGGGAGEHRRVADRLGSSRPLHEVPAGGRVPAAPVHLVQMAAADPVGHLLEVGAGDVVGHRLADGGGPGHTGEGLMYKAALYGRQVVKVDRGIRRRRCARRAGTAPAQSL
jgi:hypothetical protein